ncbi:MAG: CPBP family glutamic-type intramembrane protease [Planctomycetota bacterium]|jgi:membrane protease YdiL (CAAX protease family)|nr:CPBP family glutamic-type intramembrane protease [Planctomycetota bacterium]
MTRAEIKRLGEATRDPAISWLMLVPLALLHLSGRAAAELEAFFLVESTLERTGDYGLGFLWVALVVCFLWAVGRVYELQLPWRGGAALIFIEGLVWAMVLGPVLIALTKWLPLAATPLSLSLAAASDGVLGADPDGLLDLGEMAAPAMMGLEQIHASLAVAAGAGLYEELLFRAIGVGGFALVLQLVFRNFAAELTSRRLAWTIAILLSAAAFAAAHGIGGNEAAFEPKILAFRAVAGLAFGLLFAFRGLAVCAYAHFAYDAIYLLT